MPAAIRKLCQGNASSSAQARHSVCFETCKQTTVALMTVLMKPAVALAGLGVVYLQNGERSLRCTPLTSPPMPIQVLPAHLCKTPGSQCQHLTQWWMNWLLLTVPCCL